MLNKSYCTITRFKSGRWTFNVHRESKEYKTGPDQDVIDRLLTVRKGTFCKTSDFKDALDGLSGLVGIEMIDTNGDGIWIAYKETT